MVVSSIVHQYPFMTTTYRHFLRALEKWPKDPMRPYISFPQTMRGRVEQAKEKGWKEADAQRQLSALESLLADEFKQAYPLSDKTLAPVSNPHYYERLAAELHKPPTFRAWLKMFFHW